MFANQLTTLIASFWGHGKGFAVLLVDVNNFKQINDRHGRAMGDEVLRILASRLRHSVRAADTVARHDGDEFIILLPEMSKPEEAECIAEKITRALTEPVGVGRMQLNLSVAVGIACYPASGASAEKLIAAAEEAMYAAKSATRPFLHHTAEEVLA